MWTKFDWNDTTTHPIELVRVVFCIRLGGNSFTRVGLLRGTGCKDKIHIDSDIGRPSYTYDRNDTNIQIWWAEVPSRTLPPVDSEPTPTAPVKNLATQMFEKATEAKRQADEESARQHQKDIEDYYKSLTMSVSAAAAQGVFSKAFEVEPRMVEAMCTRFKADGFHCAYGPAAYDPDSETDIHPLSVGWGQLE